LLNIRNWQDTKYRKVPIPRWHSPSVVQNDTAAGRAARDRPIHNANHAANGAYQITRDEWFAQENFFQRG